MLVSVDVFVEDLKTLQEIQEEEKKKIDLHKEIEYEFNLYKWFCKLNGYKIFEYSSLSNFLMYCLKNKIQLV